MSVIIKNSDQTRRAFAWCIHGNMLFSDVKISLFRAWDHLIFHWSLWLFTIYHNFLEIPVGMLMVNVFLVRPTRRSPKKRKFWKGSPVFPVGTFRMEIRLPFTSFLSFVLVSGLLAFGRAQSLQQQQQIWWVHSKWGIVPDSCCSVFLSNSGNIPSPAPSVSSESTDGSSRLDRWKIQTYDFLSQHGQIMLILESSLAWRDNPEILGKW